MSESRLPERHAVVKLIYYRLSSHMDFNFPPKKYVGITKLIPHVSAECQDLIMKMIIYNPDERYTASQVMKHPYFKEFRE